MVQFNFTERVITAKIVYYGPALSGKTTNLVALHRATDPEARNRLVSLNTTEDRTLFFDLLPLDLGEVSGFSFRLQVYTVPGQPRYHSTRKVVLAGADGVVFVADSRRNHLRENIAALEDMRSNLSANRIDPDKVPFVLQYNKQDLADLQLPGALDQALNPRGRPSFRAVATRGEGVLETFSAVVEQALVAIAAGHNLRARGLDPALVPRLVRDALSGLRPAPAPTTHDDPAHLVFASEVAGAPSALRGGDDPALEGKLLASAIEANVGIAEALASVVGAAGALADRVLGLDAGALPDGPAATALRADAERIRELVQHLPSAAGRATLSAAMPSPAAAPSPVPAARPESSARPTGVAEALAAARDAAAGALAQREMSVVLEVPPDLRAALPSKDRVQRSICAYLEGLADASPPGSTAVVRGACRSVVIRKPDGQTENRPFLAVTMVHRSVFSELDEHRLVHGTMEGPLGEARRLTRELGGYLQMSAPNSAGREALLLFPLA